MAGGIRLPLLDSSVGRSAASQYEGLEAAVTSGPPRTSTTFSPSYTVGVALAVVRIGTAGNVFLR